MSGLAATEERGPMGAMAMSPDARAKRYEGMGTFCSKRYRVSPPPTSTRPASPLTDTPLATTTWGDVMLNEKVDLTLGVSWQGNRERTWMAWPWENMKGAFLLDVWGGREPLQRRALVRGGQLDLELDDLALGRARREGHVHGRAQRRQPLLHHPRDRGAVGLDRHHIDVAGVEDDLLAGAVRLALQLQHDGAVQALGGKVDLQVGCGVAGPPVKVVGQAAGVAGRHLCCGGGAGAGTGGAAVAKGAHLEHGRAPDRSKDEPEGG